jgi:two-component system nitrogen regulation response regulator NtrX
MPYDILVVDDEADIRDLICDILKDENYNTRRASDSISAFEAINDKVPSAVLLDIWLQGSELDGLGILEIIKRKYPHLPVIMVSGHGTVGTAVNSIKLGAYDYIEKPFTEDKLLITVKRACEMALLLKENASLKLKTRNKLELVGTSQIMGQLKANIDKVAATSSRVFITGASGSGKELVARIIHKKSKRANENFVILGAFGLEPDKIQAELFGEDEKRGINDKPRKVGLLELANNGTLFIDEVTDLPIVIQNKILRFMQEQSVDRANAKNTKLDVRIIASSSKDLQTEISQGRFRQDLYYRLNVVPIKIPALSERKEDIPLLLNHFMKHLEDHSGLKIKTISSEALVLMQSYQWPGNIRQLRNVIEWLLIMNRSSATIRADMLPPEILSNGVIVSKTDDSLDLMAMTLREAREVFEKKYLAAQMNRFNGNISRTSSFVGMERSALHRKLKSLNIHSSNLDEVEYAEALE